VTNGLISNNRTDDNAEFGIRATNQAMNNTIDSNHARGNGTFDCDDESHGGGTLGTANFWTKDHGDTSSPPGLCK
jgi:parallel beta-helix repeat protein